MKSNVDKGKHEPRHSAGQLMGRGGKRRREDETVILRGTLAGRIRATLEIGIVQISEKKGDNGMFTFRDIS